MNDKPRNRRADFIDRFITDPEFTKQRQAEWQDRKAKRDKAVNS